MDFACKQIDVEQVLQCSFGLTKAGCAVMRLLLARPREWLGSDFVAQETGYDLATAQRSLKHLVERGVLVRRQQNRVGGGYEYVYRVVDEEVFVRLVERTLDEWVLEAKREVDAWVSRHAE